MKSYLSILLILLLALSALAQVRPGKVPSGSRYTPDSTKIVSIYKQLVRLVPLHRYDSVQLHLKALDGMAPQYKGDSLYACIYTDIGLLFTDIDTNELAGIQISEGCFQTSLKLIHSIWGDTSLNYCKTLVAYANLVMGKKKDYNSAYNLFNQLLSLRLVLFGENDIRTAHGYRNVGLPLYLSKDYKNALPWFLKAWRYFEKDSISNGDTYSLLIGDIGYSYCQLDINDSAIIFFDRYINYFKQKYGEASPEHINTICTCATIFWNAKKFDEARKYYLETLPLREKRYGRKSSELMSRLLQMEDSLNKGHYNFYIALCYVSTQSHTYAQYDSIIELELQQPGSGDALSYCVQSVDASLIEYGENDMHYANALLRLAYNGYGRISGLFAIARYCEDEGLSISSKLNAKNAVEAKSILNDQEKLVLGLPEGHAWQVKSACFSPDDKLVLTASGDYTLKLWDAGSRRALKTLSGHTYEINAVAFSPDGKYIASASGDNTAKIWEVKSGTLLFTLNHLWSVEFVSFSPDSKYLVTLSGLHGKIWEVATGNLCHTLFAECRLYGISFSRDGKYIGTGSLDSIAMIWDVSNGNLIRKLTGHSKMVNCAVFSPSNQYILTASDDNTAKIWNASTGEVIHTFAGHTMAVNNASFSHNEKYIATGSADSTAKIWEIESGRLINTFTNIEKINEVSFSPDSDKCLLVVSPRQTQLWDLRSNKLKILLNDTSKSVNSAVFNHSGRYIITGLGDKDNNGSAELWDTERDVLISAFEGRTKKISSACYSRDNRYIITASSDKTAKVYDARDMKLVKVLKGHTAPLSGAIFSNDSKYILTYADDSTTRLWDAETGQLLNILQAKGISKRLRFACFSSNDKYIVTLYAQCNSVQIWDGKTGKLLRTLTAHLSGIESVVVSDDSKLLVTASSDSSAVIWNLETGRTVHTLTGHKAQLNSACFSRDNQYVVTASLDRTAKVWETVTGKLLQTFNGHTDYVDYANFSNDGKYVATGSWDKTARVWDVKTGKLLHTLTGHTGFVYNINFSNDGLKLYTHASDKTIKVWNLSNDSLLSTIDADENNTTAGAALFSSDDKNIVVHKDCEISIVNLASNQELLRKISIDDTDWITLTPDKYYTCTKKAATKLYYIQGLQTIGFEQLDLKYNRPDKVALALGEATSYIDTGLINSYHHAWQKRIERLAIDTANFREGFSVPECKIANREKIVYERTSNKLIITVSASDSIFKLTRFNVWVNEVPLFGMKGLKISEQKNHAFERTVVVRLSSGQNRIETSVTNNNGIESYRLPLYVRYTPPAAIAEKVYFVGIGIEHFKSKGYDLHWCTKDIKDMADALKKRYGNDIIIDTLFDQRVTRENVRGIKKRLAKSGVDDKVIIAFSGHGLFSKQHDYYLSTYDINFDNPADGGLAYDDLEWLLDGIPARKKLMLLDACNSGEIDKKDIIDQGKKDTVPNENGVVTRRASVAVGYKTIGLKNSFDLMQELFVNVGKSTGATVIAASGGTQFAREKGDLKNGVFTYSILEMMQKKQNVTVSQLKQQVITRVPELTKGLQQPTSRNEMKEFDWQVW